MTQKIVTEEDLQWWAEKAPTLTWTFAKTMADFPHSYVVLGRTPDMTEEDYERAGRVIRAFGKPGRFYSKTNIYLTIGDTKYWIMPDKGRDIAYNATLINKAEAKVNYGTQDAPDTTSSHPSIYDSVAVDYDLTWTKPSDLEENEAVASIIKKHFGAYAPKTLDVGCGTGLILDMGLTAPSLYTGIDPSQGMLNELVAKHTKVKDLHAKTLEDFLKQRKPLPRSYELVSSTFASPSYIEPWAIKEAAHLASSLAIFMVYDGTWLPHYYDEHPAPTETFDAAREAVLGLLEDHKGYRTKIGAFDTVVLTP